MKKYLFLFGCFMSQFAIAQINITGDQYHLYGPNSTWGAHLQVGGNGRVTEYASVVATNGNLHLDAKSGGFATYLNHYSQNNTLINTGGGNVGIGLYNPLTKLDINGGINTNNTSFINGVSFKLHNTYYRHIQAEGYNLSLLSGDGASQLFLPYNNTSSVHLINYGLSVDKNVGIGITTPQSKLQVNSDNVGSGTINWIAGNFGGLAGDRVVMGILRGTASIGAHNNALNAWANLSINPDGGNVGIGTTDTKGYKLAVAGNLIAEEVKVKLQGAWPDYVFNQDYQLSTLDNLEGFIKTNHHLPNIPKASEVKSDGIDLGEMNKKLLEKIEELTIYVIELHKENQKQNEEIKLLKIQKK